MPCTYTGSFEGDQALSSHQLVTELTQMLCACCKKMEQDGTKIPRKVKSWWVKHKKLDRKQELK